MLSLILQILAAYLIGSIPTGFWIGKVSAAGEASDIPMQQILFAIAGPRGDQVLLSFTVETEHAGKLAGRDLSLVKTVTLPTLQTTGGNK